jgi:pimeloyl-ACP methyl ester carboxylesterase
METVEHHGRETAYRVTGGDGPTTLFVHGSGGTHRVWANQYGPDGPRPAVALDLSGHGDSEDVDADPGRETLRAYAADVRAVARETDAAVLVGNSLGGAVVLSILLDGALDPAGAVLQGTGAKLAVSASLRDALAEDFEAAVEALHGPDRLFHDADAEAVERSKAQFRATGRAVTERDFLTCHRFDVRERLAEIATPVLALVGEHDQLTPVAYHEALAEGVTDGRLTVVEDAAHLAMVERPGAVSGAIARFRDRVVQGP